jgi:hypothetical protein
MFYSPIGTKNEFSKWDITKKSGWNQQDINRKKNQRDNRKLLLVGKFQTAGYGVEKGHQENQR